MADIIDFQAYKTAKTEELIIKINLASMIYYSLVYNLPDDSHFFYLLCKSKDEFLSSLVESITLFCAETKDLKKLQDELDFIILEIQDFHANIRKYKQNVSI